MRLLELSLLSYGPFSDEVLAFADDPALEVVYGPNEAGKSTALRAITGFFYGIPEKTSDDHLHEKARLRIGGRLRDGRGDVLAAVRRKGRKATLLDADNRPLDETVMQRALGGVSRELFLTMFGLDHRTLAEGAQALLRGEGHVGESLFDAGGARGVGDVLARLREEADALFKPRGTTPKLNDALREHKEAKQLIVLKETLPRGYLDQKQRYQEAQGHLGERVATRQELGIEKNRLERLLRVQPHLARRRDLLERRALLGEVAHLSQDASGRRLEAQRQLDACERDRVRLESDIAKDEAELELLVDNPDLAALDGRLVDELRDRLGKIRHAALDLPKRQGQLSQHEREVARLLRELGRDPQTDAALLAVDRALEARIEKLARSHERCVAELERVELSIEQRRAARESARARRNAANPLAVEHAVLPARETIDAHERALFEFESERKVLATKRADLERDEERITQALEDLERAGDIPSLEQLTEARARRDAAWTELRAGADRWTDYESLARQTDALADRLWREADRVVQRARLQAERAACARAATQLDRAESALFERRDETQATWRALFQGIEPCAPPEARRIAERYAELDRQIEELNVTIQALEAERAKSAQVVDRWRSDWAECMQRLGLGGDALVEEAGAYLTVLRELASTLRDVEQLRGRIAGIERDAAQFDHDVRTLTKRCFHHSEGSTQELATELVRDFGRAREIRQARERLQSGLEEKSDELERVKRQHTEATTVLSELMRTAHVTTVEDLETAERRWRDFLEVERELRVEEERLFQAGDGSRIDELEAMTLGLDVDAVKARLDDLTAEQQKLNEEIDELNRQIGSDRRGLEMLEQREGAFGAAADVQASLATIGKLTERYVRTRLAIRLLEQEIERYRQENQGPVVARASELFPRLTLGAYRELIVDYRAKDEPELRCLRADGRDVGVEALSDGTRDQLYLALRLASLERHAERSEPLPFIVDDILVHFDEDRARAALSVLSDFCRSSQVLFFTHSERLLELAREVVPAERLREHHLRR